MCLITGPTLEKKRELGEHTGMIHLVCAFYNKYDLLPVYRK